MRSVDFLGMVKVFGWAFIAISLISIMGPLLAGLNYLPIIGLRVSDDSWRAVMIFGIVIGVFGGLMAFQSPKTLGVLIIALIVMVLFFLKQWGIIGKYQGGIGQAQAVSIPNSGKPLWDAIPSSPTAIAPTLVPENKNVAAQNTSVAQAVFSYQQAGWRIKASLTPDGVQWCKTVNIGLLPAEKQEKARMNCSTGYTWERQ